MTGLGSEDQMVECIDYTRGCWLSAEEISRRKISPMGSPTFGG